MRHLPAGVHPGIRAPGTVDGDPLAAAELGESRFQTVLHGVVVRLALPALKGTAVVGDDHPQPSRSRQRAHPGSPGNGEASSRNATASRYVCRIICAAAWSMTDRLFFTFRPLACIAFCAATVVSRSS